MEGFTVKKEGLLDGHHLQFLLLPTGSRTEEANNNPRRRSLAIPSHARPRKKTPAPRIARLDGIARARLTEERKSWRKSHTHGFVAKPDTLPDGSVNLMVWRCVIPGKEGTDWEGGYYALTLQFNEDYPSSSPTCKFPSGFFHINVYDSGAVCLSILSSEWKPSITAKQILVGIQELLDNPNPNSAAQNRCYQLLKTNMPEYRNRVRQQAKRYLSLV